jgi:hypothetical protein
MTHDQVRAAVDLVRGEERLDAFEVADMLAGIGAEILRRRRGLAADRPR